MIFSHAIAEARRVRGAHGDESRLIAFLDRDTDKEILIAAANHLVAVRWRQTGIAP
jgi:hypothetical protein